MRRNIARALDVLETALKAGDVRVALKFGKRADKDVPPIGPASSMRWRGTRRFKATEAVAKHRP